MSINQIRTCLEEILHFMQPHWEFVNCHMVSYLTEKHWERYVPLELQHEVPDVKSVQNCIEEVLWKSAENIIDMEIFSGFKKFLHKCDQKRLDRLPGMLTSMEVLKSELQLDEHLKQNLKIKEFMSDKKRHEVELTAVLIDRLIHNEKLRKSSPDIFIVDAGDGKGYLSSRLALQYGHRVLGIDFQELNTENALERNRKLQRVWNGLVRRAEQQQQDDVTSTKTVPMCHRWKEKTSLNVQSTESSKSNEKETLYKTTAAFITPDINLIKLLQSHFPTVNEKSAICLIGLHTCGNLAPTCLRLFHKQSECKLICNIGCCYHLLKEAYAQRDYFENETLAALQTSTGFPMSSFLCDKHIVLGRNARMLATQSFERVQNDHSPMNISLFYRALLEVLICEKASDMKHQIQVGKIRKFENFHEYIALCCKKISPLNPEFQWSANAVDMVEKRFANDAHYMHLFYLLRMCFAQVLESLILLDRLLYLKEMGYEKSYLIPVFDAVISPRRFGLVALKDTES